MIVDERIEKYSNKNRAKAFVLLMVLTVINIIIKLCLNKNISLYITEVIALIIGLGYYLIDSIRSKTLIKYEVDEYYVN